MKTIKFHMMELDPAHCYSRASPSSSSTFNNGYITYNLCGAEKFSQSSSQICDRSLRNKLFLTHLWRPQLKARYAYDHAYLRGGGVSGGSNLPPPPRNFQIFFEK